ncbi:hypothetical protein [Kineosporia babensis]|uniref:Uncharacterized protein n=1 Tax=Kineosporia babensis TaxID=499548 RepID=A0A9X1NA75_9ACTN|nr:hypothetical protein [Kineosporia babensis]MCD5310388.1 hypothetical protein [Kineosporia babensis]
MTIFATPGPTWNAMIAALDDDAPDENWAFKLVLQCRDHTRLALQMEESAEVIGPAITEWNRDPGARTPRRLDAAPPRRGTKDIAGGPHGPQGSYKGWHVLLGTLIGNEFEDARKMTPTWTRSLYMEDPWTVPRPGMTDHQIRTTTPDWLSERGVYVSDRDLGEQ